MRKDIYDKIVLCKNFSLLDITNIDEMLKEVMFGKSFMNKPLKFNLENGFEIYNNLKKILSSNHAIDEKIIVNECMETKDFKSEVFETAVFFQDKYYINYLISINKCKAIIKKDKLQSEKMLISDIMENVKVNETSGLTSKSLDEPIIIMESPAWNIPTVVDGNHRLKQLQSMGEKYIKVYNINSIQYNPFTGDSLFMLIDAIVHFIDAILIYRIYGDNKEKVDMIYGVIMEIEWEKL